MQTTIPRTKKGKKINLALFAAKCIADQYGHRGSPIWTAVKDALVEGQRTRGITSADFAGMNLDEIRANAKLRD